VNQDFGSIFSTLLPGTQAKLEPAERSVLEGLEVKVAFGSVWKESLSELSGGQRSLLALSLILALLRFKPAPMYILDEVMCLLGRGYIGVYILLLSLVYIFLFRRRRNNALHAVVLYTYISIPPPRLMLHWTCHILKISVPCFVHISRTHSSL
jgi:hypothetical protein